MFIEAKTSQVFGKIARVVRQDQQLDQATTGSYSNCGINFVSQFENGKPTVQLAKVLAVLEALGVKVWLDVPDSIDPEKVNQALMATPGSEANG